MNWSWPSCSSYLVWCKNADLMGCTETAKLQWDLIEAAHHSTNPVGQEVELGFIHPYGPHSGPFLLVRFAKYYVYYNPNSCPNRNPSPNIARSEVQKEAKGGIYWIYTDRGEAVRNVRCSLQLKSLKPYLVDISSNRKSIPRSTFWGAWVPYPSFQVNPQVGGTDAT